MERLHNYVYGGPVWVQTDHKPLEAIWKKSIATTSPRLQRLLLRLARYEIQLEFISGKDNAVADTMHNHLDRTRNVTIADPALCQLQHYIFHGWPLQKRQLPEQVQHYWNYCEDLAVEDGLIFKAHWLVITNSQRAEYLKDLHAGHLREEKNLLRACERVFRPGISDDVRNTVKACEVCQEHKPAQQKLVILSMPNRFENKPHLTVSKINSPQWLATEERTALSHSYQGGMLPVIRRLISTTYNNSNSEQHVKSIFGRTHAGSLHLLSLVMDHNTVSAQVKTFTESTEHITTVALTVSKVIYFICWKNGHETKSWWSVPCTLPLQGCNTGPQSAVPEKTTHASKSPHWKIR